MMDFSRIDAMSSGVLSGARLTPLVREEGRASPSKNVPTQGASLVRCSEVPQHHTQRCVPPLSQKLDTRAPMEESENNGKRQQRADDVDELVKALKGMNLNRDHWMQTTLMVKSADPVERYEGTRRFRMMLSVSGEIPIQDVIETGVVPLFVRFLEMSDDELLFEAAWALTNIASGTAMQTRVVVECGSIPRLANLLSSPREDIREQGMWGLGNIAGDKPEYRDAVLGLPGALESFLISCRRSRRESSIRTAVWSLSNLCRGKPRPSFALVRPCLPFLADVLTWSSDSETLSDACWALDGLSEQVEGVPDILCSGSVPYLVKLLSHPDVLVQRPALRVIGQIATGTADQTQQVIDVGCVGPLVQLLKSSRKSIRKDACWTLSNIAAGPPGQLQHLILSEANVIPALVTVFHNDDEFEVKKEAAWAICNACTTPQHDQMEYLISCQCVKPVCDMLQIDDPRILEIVLDALNNILLFGSESARHAGLTDNPCVGLVKAADGLSHLYRLHSVAQGHGSLVVWQKSGELLQKRFLGQLRT